MAAYVNSTVHLTHSCIMLKITKHNLKTWGAYSARFSKDYRSFFNNMNERAKQFLDHVSNGYKTWEHWLMRTIFHKIKVKANWYFQNLEKD